LAVKITLCSLIFGEGQEKIYSGNDECVMGLENAIKNAHEVARKTLNSTQMKMKRDYDVKILEVSRPNINIFGVKPVLRLIQDRIAPASWDKCSSQFSWELSTKHLTASIKLLFCLIYKVDGMYSTPITDS
jgi:hypothetical protein